MVSVECQLFRPPDRMIKHHDRWTCRRVELLSTIVPYGTPFCFLLAASLVDHVTGVFRPAKALMSSFPLS